MKRPPGAGAEPTRAKVRPRKGADAAFQEAADRLDLRVWMRFRQTRQGKKKLNRPAGGLITGGDQPWPIQPYEGSRSVPAAEKPPADRSEDRMLNKVNRRSLCEFERVPVGFLTWFFDPSLQRGIIAELTADWAAGTLENGPVEAYA